MVAIGIDTEPKLAWEECTRLRKIAEQNARELGLSDREWRNLRKLQGGIIGDILMAVDPRLPEPPPDERPKGFGRPFWSLKCYELATELQQASRTRDVLRLQQLLDECRYRRTRVCIRLAASIRLTLLAIERPDDLPFQLGDIPKPILDT